MKSTQLCTFRLDNHWLGLEAASVQEVVRLHEITPVPLAPPAIAGLVNLRGQIVPAIDLRRRLELAPKPPGGSLTGIMIRNEGSPVSLLVDEVGSVIETDDETFERPPETVAENVRGIIRGVHKLKDGLLLMLDVERTLAVPSVAK